MKQIEPIKEKKRVKKNKEEKIELYIVFFGKNALSFLVELLSLLRLMSQAIFKNETGEPQKERRRAEN